MPNNAVHDNVQTKIDQSQMSGPCGVCSPRNVDEPLLEWGTGAFVPAAESAGAAQPAAASINGKSAGNLGSFCSVPVNAAIIGWFQSLPAECTPKMRAPSHP